MSTEYISVKELASKIGMDRSHARRYIKKMGIDPKKHRTPDSGGQLTLTVTVEEAELIQGQRLAEGFSGSNQGVSGESGHFYLIQLVPELDPRRLKLGFADSVEQRLSQHRTSAPTAQLIRSWPCKRSWEKTVIDSLVRSGGKLILNEVFEFEDIDSLIEHTDKLFGLLGDPDFSIEISVSSPHKIDSKNA